MCVCMCVRDPEEGKIKGQRAEGCSHRPFNTLITDQLYNPAHISNCQLTVVPWGVWPGYKATVLAVFLVVLLLRLRLCL